MSTDVPGGPVEPAGHPSDATIGAYLDGRLDPKARASFEAHAADCETCVELLALSFTPGGETGQVRPLDDARPRTAFPRWTLAAAAALLAGVALVVPFRGRFRSPLGPLIDATRDTRPVEARLSGGFLAAPLAEVERGASGQSTASWRVIAAAEEVRKRAAERSGAEASHLEGIALLSAGHVDEAILKLEAARRGASRAALLADLAAAYLEKSRRESDAAAAARALELSLAALAVSPRSPEALFNRALATERLGLRSEAVARYDEFLAVEPAGGWAEEARRRRAALAGAVRDGARSPPRRVERDVLPALAQAALSAPRDERAVAALLGRIEREAGADRALLVTARRIAVGGPAGLRVARGVDTVARAVGLEARGLRQEAGDLFRDAEKELEPTSDPFRLRARLGRLISVYHSQGFAVDVAELEALARSAAVASWPTLSARAWWMAGLVHAGRDAPEAALDRYETARREAEAAGEPLLVAAVDSLMGEVHRLLGNERAAWDRRALAFLSLEAGLPPVRAHSLLFEASDAAEAAALPRLALDLLAMDASRARATGQGAVAEDEIVAARAANAPTLKTAAASAWRRAEVAIALVPDPVQRSRLTSELLAARALSAAPGASRLADLDRAIDYFVATDAAFRLPELLLARASARRAAGLVREAGEDAERALALLEKELAEGGPRSLRVLERSGALVDRGLDLVGLSADPVERIERIDAFRGNDLRRWRGEGRGAGGVRQLLATLDPGTAILWLRVGERQGEALLLCRGAATRTVIPADAAGLDADTRAFREALLGGDERRALELAIRLHALLLGSVPPSTRRLYIVPDGPLWRLPFSALRGGAERPPAGVERALSLAVSAPALPASAPADGMAVLLADPRTEGTGFPRLPGAAREATRIASLHRGARLVLGDAATVAAFRELAPLASLLHVGAHAVPEAGTGGRLLLAGDGGSLPAAHVAALDLRGLRVAVLAGCDTAAGEVVSGEGTISLSRAFLAAGARAAVGSSWPIPDGGAEDLLVSLHEGLARGLPPAEALRRARAEALERPGASPRVWASFEVYE